MFKFNTTGKDHNKHTSTLYLDPTTGEVANS